MELLLALLLSFVPALACAFFVYWLDRYEKEPLRLVGLVFGWGAVVAVFGAAMIQVVLGDALGGFTSEYSASIVGALFLAPITEESLKGLAVLGIFLLLRREFDSLLDGLVYAIVVGLGFTATEDVLYLLTAGNDGGILGVFDHFLSRTLMGIWDHSFYTAFIGLGLALARLSRRRFVVFLAPVAGWSLACFLHILHNTLGVLADNSPTFLLIMFLVDWSGWLFMAFVLRFALRREASLLRLHLGEEVELGLLSEEQMQTAASSSKRMAASFRALRAGHLGATRRFYQLCGELAHRKNQLAKLGEEDGNSGRITAIRAELAGLAAGA